MAQADPDRADVDHQEGADHQFLDFAQVDIQYPMQLAGQGLVDLVRDGGQGGDQADRYAGQSRHDPVGLRADGMVLAAGAAHQGQNGAAEKGGQPQQQTRPLIEDGPGHAAQIMQIGFVLIIEMRPGVRRAPAPPVLAPACFFAGKIKAAQTKDDEEESQHPTTVPEAFDYQQAQYQCHDGHNDGGMLGEAGFVEHVTINEFVTDQDADHEVAKIENNGQP